MNKKSLGAQPFLYPEPCLLVGSYDAEGKPNVMTAAWGGICSSTPPCVTVSVRPVRHTHDAVLKRKAFTVSIPSEALLRETDYVGIASGLRYDKFRIANLTPVASSLVDAPYVGECPVVLECKLIQTVEVGSHTMMIGESRDVRAEKSCLDAEGIFPDPALVKPLIYDAGGSCYYGIGKELGKAFSVGKVFLKQEP